MDVQRKHARVETEREKRRPARNGRTVREISTRTRRRSYAIDGVRLGRNRKRPGSAGRDVRPEDCCRRRPRRPADRQKPRRRINVHVWVRSPSPPPHPHAAAVSVINTCVRYKIYTALRSVRGHTAAVDLLSRPCLRNEGGRRGGGGGKETKNGHGRTVVEIPLPRVPILLMRCCRSTITVVFPPTPPPAPVRIKIHKCP